MTEARNTRSAPILVVDDEADIRGLVRVALEREGHTVVEAVDGIDAVRKLYELRPALVILDVMMPELDGWATLGRIRDVSEVPIIMLTARGFDTERSRGLRNGADDYVIKPFSPMELTARVTALLRRTQGREIDHPTVYDDGFLRVDKAQRKVVVGKREVGLTPLEFRLLTTLIDHRDEVLDRDRLLKLVWGSVTAVFPEQVKLYVGYVRRKLGTRADGTSPIETVRGFGYIYRGAVGREAPGMV